ncbi:AMP-binding protein [Streptomyces sp. NBC_00335]|uniref:AMP-binding protein n=1 Tax=unclassified Streptomyces TaxID=2593676 RepID=UPI0022547292|nr:MULTISPECIES: AMP-binding protein [unclassified Streptomyces]MCX5408778.1 AMP-binding protein [Streptomyces sp. NBC_00086]
MTTLYEAFRDSAHRHPDATALEVDEHVLTYAELTDLVDRLAGRLAVAPGTRVGLVATRSLAAYAGYLAILRCGATVVPLNPTFPRQRIESIATQANLGLFLIDGGLDEAVVAAMTASAERLSARALVETDATVTGPATEPEPGPYAGGGDDIAYVLFTSGSTGRPKGVPIRNRNAEAYVRHHVARHESAPGCRYSQTFDLTFDPSVFDMFICWGGGAALVVPNASELLDPAAFVSARAITHWFCVPYIVTLANRLGLLPPGSMPTLRRSLFGGEALTLEQAAIWADAAPNSTIENMYGPTEAVVTITTYVLPPQRSDWPATANGTVPIGALHPDLEYLLLDDELCVRGPQRFDGYLDPADDEGRFHPKEGPAPVPEDWYRTGDLVALQDGVFVHRGRIDQQVKFRGYRIELPEIEAKLRAVPGVTEAVVLHQPGANGGRLIAVHTGEQRPTSELTKLLREELAPYMVPSRFVHVDALPTNANGKIDRRSLMEEFAVGNRVRAAR